MESGHHPHQSHHDNAHHESGHHKSHMDGLEKFFDTYLRAKAPFQLPVSVREWLVKYGPWIILVLIVLSALVFIPLLLIALGLRAATIPVEVAYQMHTARVGLAGMDYIYLATGLGALVLEAIAIPHLLKRKMQGWRLLYYSTLLSALGALLSLNIISLVLGLVIGMYILFQIRSHYK